MSSTALFVSSPNEFLAVQEYDPWSFMETLASLRLDKPSEGYELTPESVKTSLFFLQTNEIGLLPVRTVHDSRSCTPTFVLGINNGATSGFSAIGGTFVSISRCKLGIDHTCDYYNNEGKDQQPQQGVGSHVDDSTEGTSSTETSPFSQMY